jgi:hypothetical protein
VSAPAYPGIPGSEPDPATARKDADALEKAMNEVRNLLPNVGSYVSEGNFFDPAWQESFWSANYARLLAVKKQLRSRRPLLRASRGGQRTLERRRLHATDLRFERDDQK